MDGMPPEALLAPFPAGMQVIAERLRSIVRATFPTAVERVRPGWHLIGFDLPMGKRSVYFAYIAPEVEHVHLGFEHGWAMRDPGHLLQGAGITKQVRWLTFRVGDTIDADTCAALLREAATVATLSRGDRVVRAMTSDDDREGDR
jgi:hypothetical protein